MSEENIYTFENPEYRQTYWHTCSHVMANMQVVCEKYAPSIKAYLIIPLVGSLFADFLNSLTITLFINLI